MAAASDEEDGIISAINVTPLVDITLVLLIVFMVTAKIIVSQAMPLDLPKAASGDAVQQVFSLNVHANGDISVGDNRIDSEDALVAMAKDSLAKNKDMRAIIRADGKVRHERIIRVLDLLKRAGVSKIAFGVQPLGASEDEPKREEETVPAEE